jgi:hypothetical protein
MILILDIDNTCESMSIDHDHAYFIDVNRIDRVSFIVIVCSYFSLKSYIHSKAFVLTMESNRRNQLTMMKTLSVRHCFLFQENSHQVCRRSFNIVRENSLIVVH